MNIMTIRNYWYIANKLNFDKEQSENYIKFGT